MTNFRNYIPQLRRVKNEVTFYAGLGVFVLNGLIVILSDLDVSSPASWLAAGPLLSALIGRANSYGSETVEEIRGAV